MSKKKVKLWKKVLIGMILGILAGHFLPEYAVYFRPLGIIFINLIKMVVVPLIFFSILNGIASLNDTSTFGRLGIKALLIYTFTSIFAVIIGLVFANIFEPGVGANIELHNEIADATKQQSVYDILMDIVPSNPIKAMAESNILQVVMFSFFTGTALIMIGDKGKKIKDLISSTTSLVFKMMELVIQLTPYGVFGLVSWVVAQYGFGFVSSLGKFILVLIAALIVQYILFGLMLLFLARLNPIPFYKKMFETQSLAFATASSKATLTTAMRDLQEKIGVSKQSASFILPMGASMNMDATAIYLGMFSVFLAQIMGISLSMFDYATIVLTSTIGSIGAAGFPGGGMVMMGMVLSSVGLPLEGISLIMGVDRFLDMLRTTINITGDCTVTVIVDKSEKKMDLLQYYSKE